jgi:small subunit ribosomal protein S30e
MGKVHGSLARAGKVKSQTPKVEPQEKKKTPKGRAKKRITYTRRFVNVTMTGGKRKVCFSGNGEALMRVYADGIITDEPESYYVMEAWNRGCRGEERCEMVLHGAARRWTLCVRIDGVSRAANMATWYCGLMTDNGTEVHACGRSISFHPLHISGPDETSLG